jgi:hypothetical protein
MIIVCCVQYCTMPRVPTGYSIDYSTYCKVPRGSAKLRLGDYDIDKAPPRGCLIMPIKITGKTNSTA